MLLIGFAGGLRRSEITGLDVGREQSEDGRGWVEVWTKDRCCVFVVNPAGVR